MKINTILIQENFLELKCIKRANHVPGKIDIKHSTLTYIYILVKSLHFKGKELFGHLGKKINSTQKRQ